MTRNEVYVVNMHVHSPVELHIVKASDSPMAMNDPISPNEFITQDNL